MLPIDPLNIINGQVNRTASPSAPDYVVTWPINFNQLMTNVDSFQDTSFLGFITNSQLIVDQVFTGAIAVGQLIFGSGIAPTGTSITEFGTGSGGAGSYVVDPPQTFAGPNMYSGVSIKMRSSEVIMQIDVHGPASSDNVQIISTLFRDPYGIDLIHDINPFITALFTSDPKQIPFRNAEQQVETRWVIEAHLQVNQSIIVPQQFAAAVQVGVKNVEATYP